jgi:uncharacterized protein (UPF0276 family)
MAAYLWDLPIEAIGEIHVAGHSRQDLMEEGKTVETVLIDDHGSIVPQDVWTLLDVLLSIAGPKPVLVEWDNNVPSLETLLAEADKAQRLMDGCRSASGLSHVA